MNKLLIALALAPAAALVAPSVPRACVFRRLASIRSQFYIAVDLSRVRAPIDVPARRAAAAVRAAIPAANDAAKTAARCSQKEWRAPPAGNES